jgi:eukaryotic-like serine/threonine-protein kinase
VREFGPYVLLEAIAEGSTGAVYLAIRAEQTPPRPLVVKRLRSSFVSDPVLALRLRHEAMIAVSVSSPNVVRVDDVGAVGGEPYVAMEFLRGWALSHFLQHLATSRKLLGVKGALAIVAGVLRGLDALHRARHPETQEPLGFVHRDLSPRNLILEPSPRVVIIDFGLGRSNVQEWATRTGAMMGTPGYIAPETVAGLRVDHRADLYSAAVIGFELLTLKHYVARAQMGQMSREVLRAAYRPISSLREDVGEEIDEVFRRSLSIHPNDRFDSALDMLRALEGAAGAELGDPHASELPQAYFDDIATVDASIERAIAAVDSRPSSRAQTMIFARRGGFEETQSTLRPSGSTSEISTIGPESQSVTEPQEAPRDETQLVPANRPRDTLVLVRAGRAPRSAPIGAALLAAAIVLGLAFLASSRKPQMAAPEIIEAGPIARPSVEISPAAVEATDPAPIEPEESIGRERPRRRSVQPKAAAPKPLHPVLEERLERLSERAAALKRKRPDLRDSMNRALTTIALWRMSAESPAVEAAVEALEQELGRLERGAASE